MARPPDRTDGGKTGSTELARVVRERRESVGMTRHELADATGIPYPTIAQIETAYRGVSPARLGVIARVLGLDPKELYDVLASGEGAGSASPPAPGAPVASTARSRGGRPAAPAGGRSWHANPGFAAGRPAAAPMAAEAMADAPMAMAMPPEPASQRRTGALPADVVDRVVELLSSLPADQRLTALGQVQHRIVERTVQDRVARGG